MFKVEVSAVIAGRTPRCRRRGGDARRAACDAAMLMPAYVFAPPRLIFAALRAVVDYFPPSSHYSPASRGAPPASSADAAP